MAVEIPWGLPKEVPTKEEEGTSNEYKAVHIVLEYLYRKAIEEVIDFDDDMMAYGRLAMTSKTFVEKFWNCQHRRQRLFRYIAAFSHYAQNFSFESHRRWKRNRQFL